MILPELFWKELDEDAAEGSDGAVARKENERQDAQSHSQLGRLKNVEELGDRGVPGNGHPSQEQQAREDAQDHRVGGWKRAGEPIHYGYNHFSHGLRHCCAAGS
jgi:hypothetical protein